MPGGFGGPGGPGGGPGMGGPGRGPGMGGPMGGPGRGPGMGGPMGGPGMGGPMGGMPPFRRRRWGFGFGRGGCLGCLIPVLMGMGGIAVLFMMLIGMIF